MWIRDMPDQPRISFCTTCKGRRHHLERSLPENLRRNADYPNAEFVVLDYDSTDGLGEWIGEHFGREIADGRLRYARLEGAPHFKMAHAKNLAHRVATGDYLCNLDADNTTSEGFASWLADRFHAQPEAVIRPRVDVLLRHNRITGTPRPSGYHGRIALSAENFHKLGGYDEIYSAWGQDDTNFDLRSKDAGLPWLDMPAARIGEVEPHSHEERVSGYSESDERTARERLKPPASRNLQRLRVLAEVTGCQIFLDPLTHANPDGNFGCGEVQVNFGERQAIGPYRGERFPTDRLRPFNIAGLLAQVRERGA